jgi:glucosylceramidase
MTPPDQNDEDSGSRAHSSGTSTGSSGSRAHSNSSSSRTRELATAVAAVLLVAVLIAVAVLVRQPPSPGRSTLAATSTSPVPSSSPSGLSNPANSSAPSAPSPSPIEIWSTSMDRKFSTTEGVWLEPTAGEGENDGEVDVADQTILLDTSQLRQSFNAVGAALTHSSAAVLAAMPTDERAALLGELFAPDGPVRLGVLRIPLGGSDFVAEPAYTYDDLPEGGTDWDLERFSTEADGIMLRPMLRQILAIAPDLQIIASPWSAPAWLKDSDRLDGGRLLSDSASNADTTGSTATNHSATTTYARYLVRALEEYAAEEIPISAITVQNEPQLRNPDGYPGMAMPVQDQSAVISALGPALQEAGLRTRILAFDHNWAVHPADVASTPADTDPELEYPSDVLRSAAAPWISGIAYHCYSGDATRMSQLHTTFPVTDLWVTECSGSHGPADPPNQIFADTLSWQAQNLMLGSLNNWASTVLTFNLALDDTGGPHIGGCDTCTGLVTVAPDGAVTRNAEYYVLASVGRFASPDAAVLGDPAPLGDPVSLGDPAPLGDPSAPPGPTAPPDTPAGSTALPYVALANPDGSAAVVMFNDSNVQVDVAFAVPNAPHFARATVPPRSLATVAIPELPTAN